MDADMVWILLPILVVTAFIMLWVLILGPGD